jgi:hypothetical protein
MSHEREYGNTESANPSGPVFALRTFVIEDGELSSVAKGAGHWSGGVCEAVCLYEDHEAPAVDCRCGIYGALSLDVLRNQAGMAEAARWIVAVIAAEHRTMHGTVGLRTSAARVVAYWCAEPDDKHRDDATLCAEQFPGARRFRNDAAMALTYHIGGTSSALQG